MKAAAESGSAWSSVGGGLLKWGRLVKFSHTVFALPFALSIYVIAAARGAASFEQLLAILAALAAARTAAMACNRLVDWRFDALNPRTRTRELPAGEVTSRAVLALLFISSTVFMLAAAWLGRHCLVLAPFVLGWLFFYSWTKRFTVWSHAVLGVALALAPGGVWYALTARVEMLPLVLMLGVALWVCGFDLLYACQDIEFDRSQRLFSIPAAWGAERAFGTARLLHAAAVAALAVFGVMAGLGVIYFLGLGLFALLLASQHRIVSPEDLSRIDAAFFTRNGAASIVYFLAVLGDVLWAY